MYKYELKEILKDIKSSSNIIYCIDNEKILYTNYMKLKFSKKNDYIEFLKLAEKNIYIQKIDDVKIIKKIITIENNTSYIKINDYKINDTIIDITCNYYTVINYNKLFSKIKNDYITYYDNIKSVKIIFEEFKILKAVIEI